MSKFSLVKYQTIENDKYKPFGDQQMGGNMQAQCYYYYVNK